MKVNNQEVPSERSSEPVSNTSTPSTVTSNNTPSTPETDTTCWTIKLPPKTTLTDESTNEATKGDSVNGQKPVEPPTPDTPPSVTMTISSTTPAEFAKRRRIKRRSTGIEDSDSGLILSPETLPDSTNPFASNETVDAAFDVILSVRIHVPHHFPLHFS